MKYRSQASSARAANVSFGGPATFGFGSGFGNTSSPSSLSYISEQPDLSSISDPSLVVSLRNLGKKDSTTKSKALEELQEHVRTIGTEIEDAVIAAWVELYPRTSIDNSRRVRQLAHIIQGAITSAAGKRIAPRLPKVIGAWLCGQYDNDRTVARSATDALAAAFPTPEKRQALWKLYKDSLFDFAEDAILVQTVQTLSDERSTSKDDAESKHARVSGSALTMFGHLLSTNGTSSDFHSRAAQILHNKSLWDLVSHNDPYLRRSICSLATLCAHDFKDDLDWQVISSRFLSKGLAADQLGSAVQYSAALHILTSVEPTIWTTHYSGKSSASKRLCQYLRKGASRGNDEVWQNNSSLLRQIPQAALSRNGVKPGLEDATSIIEAFFDGVTNPDEPRYNLAMAWSCYIDLAFWLRSLLPAPEDRRVFFEHHIAPLLTGYMRDSKDLPSFPAASATRLISKIIDHLQDDELHTTFATLWSNLITDLVERMRMSLPESSKDFTASQDAVAAASKRLLKIRAACSDNGHGLVSSPQVSAAIRSGSEQLLNTSIDLLSNRNGKPYGSAAVLLDLVSQDDFDKADSKLETFLRSNIAELLRSPSAEHAISLWRKCNHATGPLLQSLLGSPLDERSEKAVTAIIASALPDDINSSPDTIHALCSTDKISVLAALLGNADLQQTQPAIRYFEKFLAETSTDASADQQFYAVSTLNELASTPSTVSAILSSKYAGDIVARLLYLTDSPHSNVAESASTLLPAVKSIPNGTASQSSTGINVVLDQLSGAQPQISILALVELALSEYGSSTDKAQAANGLMPTDEQWQAALQPHLVTKRPVSIAIASPLQAVVYGLDGSSSETTAVLRDSEDFSMAFRLAIYATKLCTHWTFKESLSIAPPSTLYRWLPVALQLINEKLSLESANELWVNSIPEVLDEAADIVTEGNAVLQHVMTHDPSFAADWLVSVNELQGNTVEAYVRGLAFADIASRSAQQDGGTSIGAQFDAQIKQLHKSSDLIQSAAIAYSTREYLLSSSTGRKALNELISDATQLKVDTLTIATMKPLVLLNVMLDGDSEPLEAIPSQRLVFLMQNLVSLLSAATLDLLVESEIFKLLAVVLPAVKFIYGDHWREILSTLVSAWIELNDSDEDLPMLHSTLRLYQKLKIMAAKHDVNEDLQEAWQEKKSELDNALLNCLQLFSKPSEGINQPRQICAELLGRLLRDVKVKDLQPIFPLLSSPSDAILDTVFGILHTAIPERQQDLSLELILEKQAIPLPAELLTLLQDRGSTQLGSKRYLLAWKLIFDHFGTASYKLREAYATQVKEKSNLPLLLDQFCDTFRITSNRPLDASKIDFQSFPTSASHMFDDASSLQTLSVNLYYNCLLYVPGPTKTWFIEQKNRIKSPLKAWTQKHITPHVMAAALDEVSAWGTTQDADDSPVEIKANARASELTASMPIDPESPAIAISIILPSAYPLNSPTVVGKSRVAVSDKNWQSWLRTIQIIIFSTGSIIEGLVAFRRNVQGALKGQGECAICYSIIGTDMQTPNKKCGTCKNMFHGACLFRWFKSSNSSTCPLCRNSFSYA